MREILFRGKRVDNGEWVDGYYSMCVEIGDNGGVECYYRETRDEIHYISDAEGNNFIVYPETVGQHINITMPDGTKLFEGDIVRYRFGECCCGVYEYDGTIEITMEDLNGILCIENADFVEVIGTIHDKEVTPCET